MLERPITDDPRGIMCRITSQSARFTIEMMIAGGKVSMNLSRMEMLRYIGTLKEAYDEGKEGK